MYFVYIMYMYLWVSVYTYAFLYVNLWHKTALSTKGTKKREIYVRGKRGATDIHCAQKPNVESKSAFFWDNFRL